MKIKFLSLLSLAILISCTIISCTTMPHNTNTSKKNWEDTIFKWSEKIDYNQPDLYLSFGKLASISEENKEKIDKFIYKDKLDLTDIEIVKQIYKYMMDSRYFKHYAAGGKLIAKRTVDQILQEKTLSGCHDWGLVLSTLLRSYNIPAIFCDTALIGWAEEYQKNRNASFEGHIFIEAYIDDKWVLLNSTYPEIIYDYDPQNPLLGFKRNGSNYYVMFKGIDPWDYGIYGLEDLINSMKKNARKILKYSKLYMPNGTPQILTLN